MLAGLIVGARIDLLPGRLSSLLRRSRRLAHGLNIFSGTVFTGLAARLDAEWRILMVTAGRLMSALLDRANVA